VCYREGFHRAGDSHVEEAALLIDCALGFRTLVREETVLGTDEKDVRELKAFGGVEGDEGGSFFFLQVVVLAVGGEGAVIKERLEFFALGDVVAEGGDQGVDRLAALLRREAFQVIGISAGSNERLEVTAAMIRAVRRSVLNRGAGIMVGGPIFVEKPECVALVGADATATDGRQAVTQAERLQTLMTHWD
jgi:methylmalonyl-CoA mutase cobalamin-binding subunit